MRLFNLLKSFLNNKKSNNSSGLFKYIGPGLLVTVGFIDPGNWATNLAAGSSFGYSLLWVVTLSTIILIVLQHNVAHLGIVTGKCLSEAVNLHFSTNLARTVLGSAVLASIATSLAEILGGAIALQMIFNIPIKIGSIIVTAFAVFMILNNSYKKIEHWIIGFISIIGFSFIYELTLVPIEWELAINGWTAPLLPDNSTVIALAVLGAVVMPNNLFLHSEIIQSRQWNLKNEKVIKKQLRYEFLDTFLSMGIGWAINSAMIILAASTFYAHSISVTELQQAKDMLMPLLGKNAAVIFAIALLFSGASSTITSGIAGGTIFAGMFNKPYAANDKHTRIGICTSLFVALLFIMFIQNPFTSLIYSQVALSIQLPITIFSQIYITANKRFMGKYANSLFLNIILVFTGLVVSYLNIRLLLSFI